MRNRWVKGMEIRQTIILELSSGSKTSSLTLTTSFYKQATTCAIDELCTREEQPGSSLEEPANELNGGQIKEIVALINDRTQGDIQRIGPDESLQQDSEATTQHTELTKRMLLGVTDITR